MKATCAKIDPRKKKCQQCTGSFFPPEKKLPTCYKNSQKLPNSEKYKCTPLLRNFKCCCCPQIFDHPHCYKKGQELDEIQISGSRIITGFNNENSFLSTLSIPPKPQKNRPPPGKRNGAALGPNTINSIRSFPCKYSVTCMVLFKNLIIAGTNEGRIVIWDINDIIVPVYCYFGTNNPIKCIDAKYNMLIIGHQDGTMNLCEIPRGINSFSSPAKIIWKRTVQNSQNNSSLSKVYFLNKQEIVLFYRDLYQSNAILI